MFQGLPNIEWDNARLSFQVWWSGDVTSALMPEAAIGEVLTLGHLNDHASSRLLRKADFENGGKDGARSFKSQIYIDVLAHDCEGNIPNVTFVPESS